MRASRITALLVAQCLAFVILPTTNAVEIPKAFNGENCTIIGTGTSERLMGTSRADVICGLGGNDTISGLGGNDTIDGGEGNDILAGGDANDTIYGGGGNDAISGQNGNDILVGQNGNDSINGDSGNDILQGQSGSDVFTGGTGIDTVTYSEVSDNLTLDIDSKADDGVTGENDNIKTDVENITGGQGNDKITGSSSANFIYGGSGNDMIYGGSGNDMIYGESGNDGLIGNAGVDNLNGGAGRNFCKIDGSDPKYLTCAGNYLELAEKKIEGRITFDSSTAMFKAVVKNNSTYWQNLSYLEMHYTIDGEAKWGMGQEIGWVGPGQTAVAVGGWDPNGDLIPAQPEYGIEAYETFGVFEILSSTKQWLRWDSYEENVEPNDIETPHEINPGVSVKLGNVTLVKNYQDKVHSADVSFTATNTTNVSGPLTFVAQFLNLKGEVVCQGRAISSPIDQYYLQANSMLSGAFRVEYNKTCYDQSLKYKRFKVAFVSLK
jgi:hypothetical protein